MKVSKVVWPLCVVGFFAVACEDKNEAAAPAADAAPAAAAAEDANKKVADAAAVPVVAPVAKEPAIPGVDEVCKGLVEAAKGKDEAKVLAVSTANTVQAVGVEAAKEHLFTILGESSCGVVKSTGDESIVTLSAGEASYDAQFIKSAEGWKFDGAAFLAKYPPVAKKAAGKKAAGKAKHGHGKHKH